MKALFAASLQRGCAAPRPPSRGLGAERRAHRKREVVAAGARVPGSSTPAPRPPSPAGGAPARGSSARDAMPASQRGRELVGVAPRAPRTGGATGSSPARRLGQRDELAEPGSRVGLRERPAALVPVVEARQRDSQDRRLERVEARVAADPLVGVLSREPWKRSSRARSASSRRGGDRAAVAEAEEVLGREEAEGRDVAQCCRRACRRDARRRPARRPRGSRCRGPPSSSRSSAIGATRPNRSTAITARVAGVRTRSTVSAVMQNVSGSTSQKTGRAPVCGIASALA